MKPREDCICDSLGEFVEVESTGRMSRHLVPPASHPASRDFLCRFVLPSQHLSASNFPDPPTNGSRSAEPFTGQRGGSGSKTGSRSETRIGFLGGIAKFIESLLQQTARFHCTGCWQDSVDVRPLWRTQLRIVAAPTSVGCVWGSGPCP